MQSSHMIRITQTIQTPRFKTRHKSGANYPLCCVRGEHTAHSQESEAYIIECITEHHSAESRVLQYLLFPYRYPRRGHIGKRYCWKNRQGILKRSTTMRDHLRTKRNMFNKSKATIVSKVHGREDAQKPWRQHSVTLVLKYKKREGNRPLMTEKTHSITQFLLALKRL